MLSASPVFVSELRRACGRASSRAIQATPIFALRPVLRSLGEVGSFFGPSAGQSRLRLIRAFSSVDYAGQGGLGGLYRSDFERPILKVLTNEHPNNQNNIYMPSCLSHLLFAGDVWELGFAKVIGADLFAYKILCGCV